MLEFSSLFNAIHGLVRSRFGLAKVPLCLLIGISTIFGYVLADPVVTERTFLTGFGIFILATGAATLNSLQEYSLDGEFNRTRNRPLPKGVIRPQQAGIQALGLLCFGLMILFVASETFFPVLIAVFSVFLYNSIYTPLKKKTVLAILPGAICGALPPYIGWIGGGGQVVGYPAALLIALFVLWQIPHFWLVLLTYQEDYQKSSLPNLLLQFREDSLKRFLVTWIGALVSVMLMFLTLPYSFGWSFRIAIIANGCLLLVAFIYGLIIQKASNYRILFIVLNLALFLHMLVLSAGRVFA